ncbi:MAG: glycoside hydrolase [Chloroflexota bacterium]|nr:glycoside hydrolase [Chloroflexota bacterium]
MSNLFSPARHQPPPSANHYRWLPASLLLAITLVVMPVMFSPATATSPAVVEVAAGETTTSAVRDGDFESLAAGVSVASSPWRFTSRQSDRTVHVGQAGQHETAVRLCGVPDCQDQLAQEIKPPLGHRALTLVYSLRTETTKPPGNGCEDNFVVRVTVENGAAETVGRSCEEVAVSDAFAQHRIDITALAAQAVQAKQPLRMTFVGRTTGATASTHYWLDDVAVLGVDRPPGPANVRVSSGGFSAYSEPHVAVDSKNPERLVGASKFFTDNSSYGFRVGVFFSDDGGRSWSERGILPGLEAFAITSDPVVAFGPDGEVYVAVIAVTEIEPEEKVTDLLAEAIAPDTRANGGWGVFTYRSNDGGETFAAPVKVDIGSFDDKEWLAVDVSNGPHRGNVYVVWQDNCVTSFSRSTDGGRTFSPRKALLTACAGAQVAVGPDGTIYVLGPTYTPHPDVATYRLTVSRDGGRTFDEPRAVIQVAVMPGQLNGGFRAAALPGLAVAPDTGDLVVVWNDDRNGNVNIWLSRSTDGGASFSEPIHVNDIARGDQFQPSLAIAAGGTVVVSWFDRRADPENRLADVYIARSTDGGRRFGPAVRVSTQQFDPSLAAPPAPSGNLFFGDYQGLAITGETVIPFWNDPRTGLQQIWSARIPLSELPAKL